ncbi:MAG: glycerol-3-phosphate 1-O-acyltransferase PlsY [Candidatus Borkfalkiaceae bacterium]|nr:glycerol-3-phosphate 1-O-acyltransferase PlsY [Christensenellaceae bacterium]
MDNAWMIAICAVIGYLIGSVNVSVIVSILAYKSDIRKHGSGNAGATNMARVYGVVGGIVVLIGDFGKAILAMAIALAIGGESVGHSCMLAAGVATVIGHAYPLYFRFKGGKGVTVGAAIALMIDYRLLLIIFCVFVLLFLIRRIVSLSSVGACGSLIVASVGFYAFQLTDLWSMITCVVISVFVIFLHRSNIARLLKGEEKEFSFKRKSGRNDS